MENGLMITKVQAEVRIQMYKQQVVGGYLGIGRTLQEVKDAGAVPHGMWESWCEEQTGMSIRSCQRCMKAAREIGDGSSLARLDMSKAWALLSSGLEEEKREKIAQSAADNGDSLRDIQEAIRKAREQAISQAQAESTREMNRVLGVQRQNLQDQFQEQLRRQIETRDEQVRYAKAREDEMAKKYLSVAEIEKQNAILADDVKGLEEDLRISENLRKQEHEKVIELMASRDNDGRSATGSYAYDPMSICMAIRTFMTEANTMLYHSGEILGIDNKARTQIFAHVRMVADWADRAGEMMNSIDGEVIIHG